MKVSLDVLRRVYNVFQSGGGGGDPSGGGGADDDDFLDLDAHLHFIDAYDMPLWNWSTERVAFERYVSLLSLPLPASTPFPYPNCSPVSGMIMIMIVID